MIFLGNFWQSGGNAMGPTHSWLEDEPLDISIVPRTAPPLMSAQGEPASRRPFSEFEQGVRQAIQKVVEIIGGDRPLTQALRWTSAEVYEDLARRTSHLARAGRYAPGVGRVQRVRPRVTGVVSSSSTDGVIDAAVVVRTGHRARAVATQFAMIDGRWMCTVLDFGEAPLSARSALRDTA